MLMVAFLLIGPVPFLDGLITASLHYEYCVVILFGIGYSVVMVSTFGRAIKGVVGIGFNQDDMRTQLMITGIFVKDETNFTYKCFSLCIFKVCGQQLFIWEHFWVQLWLVFWLTPTGSSSHLWSIVFSLLAV